VALLRSCARELVGETQGRGLGMEPTGSKGIVIPTVCLLTLIVL
jgi:hypothetical protein